MDKKIINEWIYSKLKEVADILPSSVHDDPEGFSCGFNTGYKHALLDLNNFIQEKNGVKELSIFFHKCIC